MSDSADSPKPSSPQPKASPSDGSKPSQGAGGESKPNRNRRRRSGGNRKGGPKTNERDARGKSSQPKSGNGGNASKDGANGEGTKSKPNNRNRNRNRNKNRNRSGNEGGKQNQSGNKGAQKPSNAGKRKPNNRNSGNANRPAEKNKAKDESAAKPGIVDRVLIALGLKKATAPAPKSARQKEIRRQTQQEAARQAKIEAGEVDERPAKPKQRPSSRLYVGNLSYDVTEQDLQELFKGIGNVRKVEIIYNSSTHRSKGFGFIKMNTIEEAERAIEILHDQFYMGRKMVVKSAEKDQKTESPSKATTADQAAQAQ